MIYSVIGMIIIVIALGYYLYKVWKAIKVLNEMILKFAELSQNLYNVNIKHIQKIDDQMKEMDLMKKNINTSINTTKVTLETHRNKNELQIKELKTISTQLVKGCENIVILDQIIKKGK